jgi:hypothetical protein
MSRFTSLFKKLLGDASDEKEKNVNEIPKEMRVEHANKQPTVKKSKTRSVVTANEQESGKKLWWVENLTLLYNGDKYALKFKHESKSEVTEYIYDDVEVLSGFHARLTQKIHNNSVRYGVAVSRGWTFFVTDCNYKKVTYLDGDRAVLAIDEDGDEFAIENYGKMYSIEVYREKAENKYKEYFFK